MTASRGRLIRASDSERQRLEVAIADEVLSRLQDLRDGLAALSGTPPTADRSAAFVAEATTALESLRELTKGLHPTLLTRSGLAAALTSYVGRAPGTTTLVVDPAVSAERWPDRVEAAAYFCCTHAIRHGAREVTLRVAPDAGMLEVELSGVTLDTEARQSMLDRVEALRGRLDERAGHVTVWLPRSADVSVPVG